jgi:YidC/Oxa1 family membrane protein insertase
MEQRDLLKNLLVAGAVFVIVMAVAPRLLPPPTPRQTAGNGDAGTTLPAGAGGESAVTPSGRETVAPPPGGAAEVGVEPAPAPRREAFSVSQAEAEQKLAMGGALAGVVEDKQPPPYRMQLTLSNVGASVEEALLTDHAARLDSPERYALLSPITRPDGTIFRSLAVEKVNIDGEDVVLYDKRWHAGAVEDYRTPDGEEGQKVSFWIELQKAAGDQGGSRQTPALKITRTLRLPRQPHQVGGRHDLYSTISVQNTSADSHSIVVASRGGLGVKAIDPRTDDRFIDIGVATATGHVVGTRTLEHAVADKQVQLFAWSRAELEKRLLWAASANTYFTCTIAPVDADGKSTATYISELSAFDADGDPLTTDDATVRFTFSALELRPGAEVNYPAAMFLGEKDGHAFRTVPEYSSRNYYFQIEQGFGWCTFTFLVELMIWLLNSLHFVVRDYGIAIIILVLIVRALLHPITKKGQVNMVRMQHKMAELGPKIEEIKKKYANDKARLNQEMMKLNINPASQVLSCLPMFIQMPIWVALYLSLSNNIFMRHAPFLYGWTWIDDLTAQDAMIPFSAPMYVPIFGWELTSFNLLPLLVALFMYVQQKTQPKPKPNPNMTDQQRQQQESMQRMMPMMSIMMMLIFYKMPSGLNLYIMFSSVFGWLEQARIRQHIREREEAGTLHAPPVSKKSKDDFLDRPPRAKLSWWQRLQKASEDAQKAQRTQRAKPRR